MSVTLIMQCLYTKNSKSTGNLIVRNIHFLNVDIIAENRYILQFKTLQQNT